MRRTTSILVAAVIGASLAAPTSARADTACASGETRLRTFHVEAVPEKKKVRRGEKFMVEMTVTRPAHEDPAGQGQQIDPPASTPAEDVTTGITIFVGDNTWFWGIGITDADGKADIELKVPKNSELGWGFAAVSAIKYHRNECPEVVEEGYNQYVDFVKVVR